MSDEKKQSGFVQTGWQVGGNVIRVGLSEQERAALEAVKEWRQAELVMQAHTTKILPGRQHDRSIFERHAKTFTALRASADELLKGEG